MKSSDIIRLIKEHAHNPDVAAHKIMEGMRSESGGPAYPSAANEWQHKESKDGMTLRDAIAIAALPSCINSAKDYNKFSGKSEDLLPDEKLMTRPEFVANACYAYADAMLAEREK